MTAQEIIAGKDGIYSAGVVPGPALRAGSAGSAFFPTVNDYMVSNYNDIFRINASGGFTALVWCQPTELVAGSSEKKIVWCSNPDPLGYHNWSISLNGEDNMCPYGSWGYGHITTETKLGVGEIAFMALVYQRTPFAGNAGTFWFYVNGELVGMEEIDYLPDGVGNYLKVGDPTYPSSGGFIGCVSDITIFHRALSAAEIMSKYWSSDRYLPLPDVAGAFIRYR